jgi:SpoVK/Ycf46/Vps4 family AAA+-type ATPase
MEDWESARSEAKASMIRGVTKEAPTVSWDDIGGLKDLKVRHVSCFCLFYNKAAVMVIVSMLQKKLQQAVEWPIKHAAAFARLGISPVRGVLLHGPPGCSKTTLAKAAAHAAQASFFSLRFVIERLLCPFFESNHSSVSTMRKSPYIYYQAEPN